MSFLSRSVGTIVLPLLTVLTLGIAPATAQVSAIKDGWLVMKVHSEMLDEDVLDRIRLDPEVATGAGWARYVSTKRVFGTKVPGSDWTVYWRIRDGVLEVPWILEDRGL